MRTYDKAIVDVITMKENEYINELMNDGYIITPVCYSDSEWDSFIRLYNPKTKVSALVGDRHCGYYGSESDTHYLSLNKIEVVVRLCDNVKTSFDFDHLDTCREVRNTTFVDLSRSNWNNKHYYIELNDVRLDDIVKTKIKRYHPQCENKTRIFDDNKHREIGLRLVRKIKGHKSTKLSDVKSMSKFVSRYNKKFYVVYSVNLTNGKSITFNLNND